MDGKKGGGGTDAGGGEPNVELVGPALVFVLMVLGGDDVGWTPRTRRKRNEDIKR